MGLLDYVKQARKKDATASNPMQSPAYVSSPARALPAPTAPMAGFNSAIAGANAVDKGATINMGPPSSMLGQPAGGWGPPSAKSQSILDKGGFPLRLGNQAQGSPEHLQMNPAAPGMPAAPAQPVPPGRMVSAPPVAPASSSAMSPAGMNAVAVANSRQNGPGLPQESPYANLRPGDLLSGGVAYEAHTGYPRSVLDARQQGVADANARVDEALRNSRMMREFPQHYANGLGTGVGPANIAAMEAAKAADAAEKADIQAGWTAWHDRQRALRANPPSPGDYAAYGKTGASAPIGGAAPPQQQLPTVLPGGWTSQRWADLYAHNATPTARADAQAGRDQIAQNRQERLGREARFAAGSPQDMEEAKMFMAMRGMQTNPVATMGTLGQLEQSRLVNEIQAAKLKADQDEAQAKIDQQNYMRSPEGLANGLLLSGRSPQEVAAMGLPLPNMKPGAHANPIQTANEAAKQAQQLRQLGPDAQMKQLEGLLRASSDPNFNLAELQKAGVDENILQGIVDYRPMLPYQAPGQGAGGGWALGGGMENFFMSPFRESQQDALLREELQRKAEAILAKMKSKK